MTLSAGLVVEFRALVYSRFAERVRWIENELARAGTASTIARSVGQVVETLIGDIEHARPHMLIIDLDTLSAGELFHLHRVRELGWSGTLIALGKIPPSLRASLGVDRTIPPPFVEDALCEEILQHARQSVARTMPLPVALY
jgi:hypothetical protein